MFWRPLISSAVTLLIVHPSNFALSQSRFPGPVRNPADLNPFVSFYVAGFLLDAAICWGIAFGATWLLVFLILEEIKGRGLTNEETTHLLAGLVATGATAVIFWFLWTPWIAQLVRWTGGLIALGVELGLVGFVALILIMTLLSPFFIDFDGDGYPGDGTGFLWVLWGLSAFLVYYLSDLGFWLSVLVSLVGCAVYILIVHVIRCGLHVLLLKRAERKWR